MNEAWWLKISAVIIIGIVIGIVLTGKVDVKAVTITYDICLPITWAIFRKFHVFMRDER